MTKSKLPDRSDLRKRAEADLARKADSGVPFPGETEVRRLLHELQVHQIELELQNEELRQARQELEASLERYTDLYDFAPAGYFTLDGQAVIREVNLSGASLLGMPRSQLMGKRFEGFLAPESHPDFGAFLARLAQDQGKQSSRATLITGQEGNRRYVYIEGLPQEQPLGDTPGAVTPCRLAILDITELRHAEEENIKLEAQLRQAQKMEAIGTLAGGIAHDFNNILAAIVGYAEIARDDARAGKADPSDLQQIISSAGRAKDLVKQILAFSRQSTFRFRPLDLNQKVEDLVQMLVHMIPKDISIKLDISAQLAPINGDAGQLELVMMNLATNARDAMPEGGQLVIATKDVLLDQAFCRQYLEVPPGAYVLLSIADSGQGMDESTLERMYDPFFTTKGVGKGTGLGLSTVHGIVKSHGGHVFCQSHPGQGTTFDIYLPALLQGGQDQKVEDDPGEEESGAGRRILLVDDEATLRTVGARVLRAAGYQVLTAAGGEEAMRVFVQNGQPPDLVILDLGMPGMGGLKCLRAMLESHPLAKVLIASGYDADAQVKDALQGGAAGYVAKPFKRRELLATIRSLLDKK